VGPLSLRGQVLALGERRGGGWAQGLVVGVGGVVIEGVARVLLVELLRAEVGQEVAARVLGVRACGERRRVVGRRGGRRRGGVTRGTGLGLDLAVLEEAGLGRGLHLRLLPEVGLLLWGHLPQEAWVPGQGNTTLIEVKEQRVRLVFRTIGGSIIFITFYLYFLILHSVDICGLLLKVLNY